MTFFNLRPPPAAAAHSNLSVTLTTRALSRFFDPPEFPYSGTHLGRVCSRLGAAATSPALCHRYAVDHRPACFNRGPFRVESTLFERDKRETTNQQLFSSSFLGLGLWAAKHIASFFFFLLLSRRDPKLKKVKRRSGPSPPFASPTTNPSPPLPPLTPPTCSKQALVRTTGTVTHTHENRHRRQLPQAELQALRTTFHEAHRHR